MQPRLKLLLLLLSTFSLQACLVESENTDSKSSQKNLSSSSQQGQSSSSSVGKCTPIMSIPAYITNNTPVERTYEHNPAHAQSLGGTSEKDGPSCYDQKRWLPNGAYYAKFSTPVTFCQNGKWLDTGLRTPKTCLAMGTEHPSGTQLTAWNGEVLNCEGEVWKRSKDGAQVQGPSTPPTGVLWGQPFSLKGQEGQCRMFPDRSIHCQTPSTTPRYDSSMSWTFLHSDGSPNYEPRRAYWSDTNALWIVGQIRHNCSETGKIGPVSEEFSTWLPLAKTEMDSLRVWLKEIYQLRDTAQAVCPVVAQTLARNTSPLATTYPNQILLVPATNTLQAFGKTFPIQICSESALVGSPSAKRLTVLLQKTQSPTQAMPQRLRDMQGPSY